VAADFGMQLVRAEGVEAGKPVPEIGANADFDQSIATLKKGEVSPPVALPNDKVALAVVTDVVPARPSTFEEVQGQVKELIVGNRSRQAVQKHAQELADAVKSMGGDFEKAAKSKGLTVKTAPEVDRAGTLEGLGSAQYIADAFGKPDGALFGPLNSPNGTIVGKVLQHVPPDMSKLAEQRSTIRDQIKGEKARDRGSLFEAGLRDDLTRRGVIKIHQNVLNSLIAQYRPS
jgi:hypothetical protein